MTMTLKIDPMTEDLVISNGKFVRVTGADEVVQRIRVTLQHHWGEYFLNIPGGVPWYDLILGGKNRRLYEALLRKIILEVPGVVRILQFSVSFQNRDWSLSAMVEVSWGNSSSIETINVGG